MISKKAFLLYQKVADMVPLSPVLIRGPCLHIYSILILFILLRKYNSKIDHKSKSKGNYTKLTNGRIILNREEQRDMRSKKRHKKLRRITANAGNFTG